MTYLSSEFRNEELARKAVLIKLESERHRLEVKLTKTRKAHGSTASIIRRQNAITKRMLELEAGGSAFR